MKLGVAIVLSEDRRELGLSESGHDRIQTVLSDRMVYYPSAGIDVFLLDTFHVMTDDGQSTLHLSSLVNELLGVCAQYEHLNLIGE